MIRLIKSLCVSFFCAYFVERYDFMFEIKHTLGGCKSLNTFFIIWDIHITGLSLMLQWYPRLGSKVRRRTGSSGTVLRHHFLALGVTFNFYGRYIYFI